MSSNNEGRALARELKTQITVLGGLVALMWAIELVDIFWFQNRLDMLGIRPRDPNGLRGVLFAPFLHGNLQHLIGNTIPFLTLGWFVMLRETSDFFIVTLICAVASGLGTWVFGLPGTIHIGASGVVYGYLGYLVFRGWFERSGVAIALSLFVLALYSSLLWGLLPTRLGISWEGHLFGFLGGVLAAKLLGGNGRSVDS